MATWNRRGRSYINTRSGGVAAAGGHRAPNGLRLRRRLGEDDLSDPTSEENKTKHARLNMSYAYNN
ncbi:hypothetical protein E2562_027083 [Oryza meyeriana var. granulata]|uniref:Uncharacterized protein n=1 Tax=Oryza meyeriana var. granulata TaxID=110450 RepID=A0A6G1EZ90_9ORYZ|nr:hypothetical protein E2562_027083 [Oryza meyeriana var. granulata]